jgi:hypothetical protein
LASLVHRNQEQHGRLEIERTPHQKNVIARQITTIDREIDSIVYELYGLTDKDIRLVEDATAA